MRAVERKPRNAHLPPGIDSSRYRVRYPCRSVSRLVNPNFRLTGRQPWIAKRYPICSRDWFPTVHLDFVTENHDLPIAIANHSQLLSPEVSHYRAKCRREDRPEITIKTKCYQVAHFRDWRSRPTQRCFDSARQAEQSRQVTQLLMPRPEVSAHPATAMRKCRRSEASRRGD